MSSRNQKGFDRITSAPATNLIGLLLLVWPSIFVYWFLYSCKNHECSLLQSVYDYKNLIKSFFIQVFNPFQIKLQTYIYLGAWLVFQIILFLFVPGTPAQGRPLSSGTVLNYNCNGLNCLLITYITLSFLYVFGLIDPIYYTDNLIEFFVLSNISGFLVSLFVYIKAYICPGDKDQTFFSGSSFYDFYSGIEHSPRIGQFDFKHFINTRVGIALWPAINICYALKMYQNYGYISNSMITVSILHLFYVLDLFIFESWYMKTIDISYDHFGYYLAWGSLSWLPYMYTLQGLYLVYHPIYLNFYLNIAILMLGIISIYLFRVSNLQKDEFRECKRLNKPFIINNHPAQFLIAKYKSADGKEQISYLLADGYWGISRHFNYLTDLGNSLAYCSPCGYRHILPHFYLIYMTILLLHRLHRDDIRCRDKYKDKWEEYCKLVPYKLIPYIY